jgi:hypothetical protein
VSKQANAYCDIQTKRWMNGVMLRQEKHSYWVVMLPHIEAELFFILISTTRVVKNYFLRTGNILHFAPRWK